MEKDLVFFKGLTTNWTWYVFVFFFFFSSCFVLGWSQGWRLGLGGLEVNVIRMHCVKFPNNQQKYVKKKRKQSKLESGKTSLR